MNRMSCARLRRTASASLFIIVATVAAAAAVSAGIVDHPEKLKFEELRFDPPNPDDYRHTLKCGATAYVAENREVPTFELTVLLKAGAIYEPAEKAGLADMTGYLTRNGGVEGMTAKELDESIAYLAGEISVGIGESRGTARLFCLSKDIDEGLALFEKALRRPVFDQGAIDRYRSDLLSKMAERNSSTSDIEAREWAFLIYGDHPCTKPFRRTATSLGSITRADLQAYHEEHFFPGNFIFALSGDFETEEILEKIDGMLAGWTDHELRLPPVPDRVPSPAPGTFMVRKEDVNQSRIRLGHVGVKRDNPDRYALMVMNEILGGGGFSSRIVQRVRSDEGLAYSAGSSFRGEVLYPGTFRAWFQTKHATGAFGTRLIVDEINRIIEEEVEEELVENAKAGFIGNLVNPFSSKKSIVATFASDQYTNRPESYWRDFTENMEAVTPKDVQAAARKHLHPDKLVFLVVGDPEAVQAGSDKHEERFSDFGEITILPLRDPMTLEAR